MSYTRARLLPQYSEVAEPRRPKPSLTEQVKYHLILLIPQFRKG